MIEEIKIVEQTPDIVAFDCEAVLYVNLKKGAIVSDHSHEHEETVFLMSGEAEIIIGVEKQIIMAPAKIVIPPNIYHKFTALTDLIGLELKS